MRKRVRTRSPSSTRSSPRSCTCQRALMSPRQGALRVDSQKRLCVSTPHYIPVGFLPSSRRPQGPGKGSPDLEGMQGTHREWRGGWNILGYPVLAGLLSFPAVRAVDRSPPEEGCDGPEIGADETEWNPLRAKAFDLWPCVAGDGARGGAKAVSRLRGCGDCSIADLVRSGDRLMEDDRMVERGERAGGDHRLLGADA